MPEPVTPIRIAIIGGSGLYTLLGDGAETRDIRTPYGPARVTVGEFGGRRIAFLTRHGVDHSVAPHLIDYRANIWALASLGVTIILSSAAVGGLTPEYPPGTLVLTDQYIDRTHGRADTFFDRGSVQHLGSADPFSPALRAVALEAIETVGETVTPTGTVVVIQGPRFSTRAESRWFAAAGGHTVNMTLYPEVPLASELGIDTVNLSFVTDGDAGEQADPDEDVSAELVFRRLAEAQPRIVTVLEAIVRALPDDVEARQLIDAGEVAAVLAREPLA